MLSVNHARPVFRLTNLTMVDIHLLAHGSEVPFLSIPLADVQRLSIRPFKWLRFVLFAICGTVGELSATPGGKPVDYESTKLGVDAIYYFKPSGKFRVVRGWDCFSPFSRGIHFCRPRWIE